MKRNIMVTGMLLTGLCVLLLTACPQPEQTVVKYTVTFESNGGSAVAAQEVEKDGLVTEPTAPTKTDYTFAGWHKEAMNRNVWNFASDKVSANVTLYARWIHNSLISLEKRDMVDISGGTFIQTSNGIDGFSHTISGFQLGKYEVTYELWYTVRQWAVANGYHFDNEGREGSGGSDGLSPTGNKYMPVANIAWVDAIIWCNAYSEMSGYMPCYSYNGSILKSTDDTSSQMKSVECAWNANGYRLPSEGEWQYAASNKGATPWNYLSGAFTFYNDANDTNPANGILDGKEANDAVAIYGSYWNGASWVGTGATGTALVGTKNANPLGLFDMSGNVKEFCWDAYTVSPYPTTPQIDYRNTAMSLNHMMRGGSYQYQAQTDAVGYRDYEYYQQQVISHGMRVARYK